MTPRLTDEMREAVRRQSGRPIELRDDVTDAVYVLMSRQQFESLVYDDSDLSPDEMLAAAALANAGPEGWDAPGMDVYDSLDYDSPATEK